MFNRKSSYALNKKDPNAIVYMDANEAIIRLTREDFASEEEFLKWKSLSDADYHASEKEDHVYANHTLALDELSEEAASIPAADICMEHSVCITVCFGIKDGENCRMDCMHVWI